MRKYQEAFASALNIDIADVNEKLAYGTIPSWDSIGQMILVSSIEDAFNIEFNPTDILAFDSYQKGIELLSASYEIAF
jgi:acyl carrier protein